MLSNQEMEKRLETYDLALTHASEDTAVADILAQFGYDAAKLTEGKTLYNTALEAYRQQRQEYAEQFGATDTFKTTLQDARKVYDRYVGFARIAFKNDVTIINKLGIVGRRQKSFTGWTEQAYMFYNAALADETIQAGLAQFNITPENLSAGKALLDAAEAAKQTQKKEMSEAQRATERRDHALDDIDEWMEDFLEICKLVFTDEPQILERFGIKV